MKKISIQQYNKLAGRLKINAKIKNATKITIDNITFDSKLESYMYTLLRDSGLKFERQKVYLIQEKFRYAGEAIRPITLKVDFYLPDKDVIIDPKGHQTQQGAMRYKMLKHVFWKRSLDMFTVPRIFLPKTEKECRELIRQLL